jgi:hypothetical protein
VAEGNLRYTQLHMAPPDWAHQAPGDGAPDRQTGPLRTNHPRRTASTVEVKPALTVADAARLANTSTKFIYTEINRGNLCSVSSGDSG